ncbi:putative 4-hydroxybenzoate polyprenyl transferase [Halenospora varia]|nr:putative 4-hydroxybenzoate polyprenyl transferase [Halenospora varia]
MPLLSTMRKTSMSNPSPKPPTAKAMGYAPPNTGIFSFLPPSWTPYAELMRLDRPSGYYAFYWHYLIGLSFASCIASPAPTLMTLTLHSAYLALWVLILRGAVCTWNDNLDQDFDRKVARTRFRPIARGAVTTTQGHIFTLLQTIVGGLMLVQLPASVSVYAAIMTIILTIYPLGKRLTDFPQVILGFGFAVPIFMCCAVLNVDPLLQADALDGTETDVLDVSAGGACLYGASVLWTIIFDTVYAHQDIRDDVKAGVKSLAVRLGDQTKPTLAFLAAIQVGLLMATGYLWIAGATGCNMPCSGNALETCGGGNRINIFINTAYLYLYPANPSPTLPQNYIYQGCYQEAA